MSTTSKLAAASQMAVAAVFIHGIFGSKASWRRLFEFLAKDGLICSSCRLVAFEYPSPYANFSPLRRIPKLTDVADRLATFLQDDPMVRTCSRVALIGHSQGGLVIQQYLADMLSRGRGNELKKVRGVVTLATPNTGSELFLSARQWLDKIWYHPQERTLRPYHDEIEALRHIILEQVIYAATVGPSTCPIRFDVYAGTKDGIVPPKSAKWFFPRAGTLPGDHFSIVKPESADAPLCTAIADSLRRVRDSLFPDGLTVSTAALDPSRPDDVAAVIELQRESFLPQAQIRKKGFEPLANELRGEVWNSLGNNPGARKCGH